MAPQSWDAFVRTVFLISCLSGNQAFEMFDLLDNCGGKISMTSLDLRSFGLHLSRNVSGVHDDCAVSVRGWPGKRLMFHFPQLDLDLAANCSNSYIQVLDGSSPKDPFVDGLPASVCGSSQVHGVYYSSGDALTFRYVTESSSSEESVDITTTAFHTGTCDEDEYQCSGDRCISDIIECNDHNPCGDNSDCDNSSYIPLEIIIPIIISVGIVIAVAVLIIKIKRRGPSVPQTLLVNTEELPARRQKRNRNQKTYGSEGWT